MSELLFEIFCEEIPARMQPRAEADLDRMVGERLQAAGLRWDSMASFAGPRRLGLVIEGLPARTADVREERKGPRVGAPDKAVEGFLRGAGLESLEQCEKRSDKKGEFWVALIEKPGRATAEVIAETIPAVMKDFPWPKSMKFGEGEKTQRWVRPLQRLLCLFDGEVVDFEVFGIRTGNLTEGHRRHGPGPFEIEDYTHYTRVLREKGFVVQSRQEREDIILVGARDVCQTAGLELVEDPGLLTEVAGLVEWPVPLLGQMDPDFLDLPPEVVTLTMKTHQKYFAVKHPGERGLAPNFVVVANQAAPDGGKAIAAGNARVLSARLSDARHFWDNDRKTPLWDARGESADMFSSLEKVTLHRRLGLVSSKVERIAQLASGLEHYIQHDSSASYRAAKLCKADLVSEMVYEFPELQGAMGRYYALDQGEEPIVADAIRDHYKPQGASDEPPTAAVSAVVAIADKLDTLVSFWAIGEKPTGSKDPYALRRAALGIIRILLAGNYRLPMRQVIADWFAQNTSHHGSAEVVDLNKGVGRETAEMSLEIVSEDGPNRITLASFKRTTGLPATVDPVWREQQFEQWQSDLSADLLAFFADRLKVHLRDEGIRHDVIDAVFALGDDDLVRVTAKARALQAFLDTEDGAALLAGYNRASNIVRAEEKKDGVSHEGEPESGYLKSPPEDQERALIIAMNTARHEAERALATEDFEAAMGALACLRAPIDAFFDRVTVNAEDDALRRNRLFLLSGIRKAIRAVADFDRIAG